MRISCFSTVRNCYAADYPLLECLMQVYPICDEYLLGVGISSTDDTIEYGYKIAEKFKKVRVIETPWDLSEGPSVIATETNRILEQCQGDWLWHHQADECFTTEYVNTLNSMLDTTQYSAFLADRSGMSVNFQSKHGADCSVVRVGRRGNLRSVGDGFCMDAGNCGRVDIPGIHLYDVTRVFTSGFSKRSKAQKDVWWHIPENNKGAFFGKDYIEWEAQIKEYEEDGYPEECLKTESPYPLPEILKYHLGRPSYRSRLDTLEVYD